jgi:hypothetical protein
VVASVPTRLIVDEDAFAEFRTENLRPQGSFWLSPACSRSRADRTPIMRYRVEARFQHLNAVALVITLSRDGQVDGLELHPHTEW